MHVLVIGLNHKTAPIEVREQVVFAQDCLSDALQTFTALDGVCECALLSTCNRTEIYVATENITTTQQNIKRILETRVDRALDLYAYTDNECASHLFRVAAGLDSMMLGEHQILGQVRGTHATAQQHDSIGPALDELFRCAISTGKQARTQTDIGRGAVSLGAVAVELARSIYGDLSDCTVMLVGAGKMGMLTAKHLTNVGISQLLICNRTASKSAELADRLNGKAVALEQIELHLTAADVVISSTDSPYVLITADTVRQAMRQRRQRPLFFIDIAVPRDVDPRANTLNDVFVYDIDDLSSVIAENVQERHVETAAVEEIVAQNAHGFHSWLGSQHAKPTIVALLKRMELLRGDALEDTLPRLSNVSEHEQQLLKTMVKNLQMRMLSGTLEQLNKLPSSKDPTTLLNVVQNIFDLNQLNEESPPKEGADS